MPSRALSDVSTQNIARKASLSDTDPRYLEVSEELAITTVSLDGLHLTNGCHIPVD